MRVFYLFIVCCLSISQGAEAEPSRLELVNNILLELRSDTEIKEGGICIFKESGKPFPSHVMLECESLLGNILLSDKELPVNVSVKLIDDLILYGKSILKSLYSGDFVLKAEKEEDATIFAKLFLYLDKLDKSHSDLGINLKIRKFYRDNFRSIEPIFDSLREEQSVSKLIKVFKENEEEDQINSPSSQDVLMQLPIKPLEGDFLAQSNKVALEQNKAESKKGYTSKIFIILFLFGLLVAVFVVLGYRFLLSREKETRLDLSKEERAELRELKVFFGVTTFVSLRDLSKSYRLKVKAVHPDVGQVETSTFLDLQSKYARVKELQDRFLGERS